jgi:hypothetical protein
MNTFDESHDTVTVRVAVNPPSQSLSWSMTFRAAGWRPFYRNVFQDGSKLVWLFKREASSFLVTQLANDVQVIDVELPRRESESIRELLLSSRLARSVE